MKGFVPPEITKEDVMKFLTEEDKKIILEFMGYKVVPKDKKLQKNIDDK